MRSHAALRSLVRVAAAAFGASLLSCAGVPVDRPPPEPPLPAWSKVFGNFDRQGASAIAVDASGEAYVVGGFERSFVDAAGTEFVDPRALEAPTVRHWGVFVLRLDASGGQRWARHFAALDGFAYGEAVAVSAGKVVIAGSMMASSLDFGDAPLRNAAPPHNDVFVAAFDAETGRLLWSRTLGGAGNDFSGGVAIDPVGHVHVVYSSEFPPPKIPGTGAEETILVELGPDGELLRTGAIGGAGRNQAVAVAVSSRGTVFVSLFRRGERSWEGRLLEVDAAGRELWSRELETGAAGLAVGPDDIAYVTGVWRAPAGEARTGAAGGRIYLGAFGRGGEPLWSRHLGKARFDGPADLAVDRCGDLVLVGDYGDEPVLDLGGGPLPRTKAPRMIFLAGFDARGNHSWSQGYGGTNSNFSRALAIGPRGDVWLSGHLFTGVPIDLGDGPLPGPGQGDVLVAKWTRRLRCAGR